MSTIRFLPSSDFADPELADLFTRAYAGYYTTLAVDGPGFRRMVEHWDIDLAASRVAVDGDRPVGLVQLGVRGDRGWIGGMGVVAEGRGSGLGARLMDEAIASARSLGLATIDLEVLVQNQEAIPIYERCGFVRTRRLVVLGRDAGPGPSGESRTAVEEIDVAAVIAGWDRLHSVPSPWQRSREVIGRLSDGIEARGVMDDRGIVAGVIAQARPGVIQIVDLPMSREASPRALEAALAKSLEVHADRPHVLANLPEDDPAFPVMTSMGFGERHAQHEMRLVPRR